MPKPLSNPQSPISSATVTAATSHAGAVWAGVAVVVAAVLVIGIMALRRRSTAGAGAGGGPGRPGVMELEAEAAQLLVRTDDAVKTSEQELGFAIAQFGGDAAKTFSDALEEAKIDLSDAFWLRGKLNENAEIVPEQRYEWLQQVIAKCRKANADLDEQTAAFEQLRDLRNRTPEVLGRLDGMLGEAPARIAVAAETLRGAAGRYSAQALEPVAQNPAQATELVGFATAAADRSRGLLVDGDHGQAALAARTAQEASGQIDRLLEATDRRIADLDEAGAALPAAVAEMDTEVAEARALLGTGTEGARRLDGLEVEASRIRAAAAAGPGDPLSLLGQLQAVDARLDELMAGLLGEQERKANAEAILTQALLAARSDVAAAEDFITTRRGAIGSQARTLQAEAIRQLDKALWLQYKEDAQGSRAAARKASSYARSAQQQANADLRSFGKLGIGGTGIEGAGLTDAEVDGLDLSGLGAAGSGVEGANSSSGVTGPSGADGSGADDVDGPENTLHMSEGAGLGTGTTASNGVGPGSESGIAYGTGSATGTGTMVGLRGAVISGLIVDVPAGGSARGGGSGRNRSGPRSPGGFQGAPTAPANRRGSGARS